MKQVVSLFVILVTVSSQVFTSLLEFKNNPHFDLGSMVGCMRKRLSNLCF